MNNNVKFRKLISRALTFLLSVAMVFTMMPLFGTQTVNAYTATAQGGAVASNNAVNLADVIVDTVSATTAFGASNVSASYNSGNKTLTIILKKDIKLSSPVRFVKGENGGKIILNLNGHTITGKTGDASDSLESALGGNAIEIAADAFDVQINGPGSVIGGEGGKWNDDGYRRGVRGGSAVFFCERVDKVHYKTSQWGDIVDGGYNPGMLDYGLTITGGAILCGGDGADVNAEDWKYNLSAGDEDYFKVAAGEGGTAISQVFNGTKDENVLEELSFAKINIDDGSAIGGEGGNVDLGDQLLTTTDIQKISEIQTFMRGKKAGYSFDSNVTSKIKFVPNDGGNGIDFYAGRKYIEIGSKGSVKGGDGGRFTCSERASMVKRIGTSCGNGGKGIFISGDTGLTDTEPNLSNSNWGSKNKNSDDVGIYVAGTVIGGSSPATTLQGDSSGSGGEGIDSDLDGRDLTYPYNNTQYPAPDFDVNRGIVLVDSGGKVIGGDSGRPDKKCINGYVGGDAITGGSTGSPTGGSRMKAAYFIIKGEVKGGYGSDQGGNGFYMKEEEEYYDDTSSSAYFSGVVLGDGTLEGGDSGLWPYLSPGYYLDNNGAINYHGYYDDQIICGDGLLLGFGIHEKSATIGQDLTISDGIPAKLMETKGTFSITPSMTPFPTGTAPTADTKLSYKVKTPDGYNGKVYILWSAEYENTVPRTVRTIEPVNGAYNNISIHSNKDYPYGWERESWGGFSFKIDVATREHIAESIKYNDGTEVHIYCKAILEDGRYVENKDIWFSKERRSPKGWSGSGGDDQVDWQAINYVENLISLLPWPWAIKLTDEDDVITARSAYNALTSSLKAMVDPNLYQNLLDSEAKIRELKGDVGKVNEIVELIEALPDAENINAGNADDVADDLEVIHNKIGALTPEQQQLLADDTESIEKLIGVEAAVVEAQGGTHQHLVIHVPEKQATCTNTGNVEYWYCLTCTGLKAGRKYDDADIDNANDITETYEIPIYKTAHVPHAFAARAANCMHIGNIKYYVCTECDHFFKDEACSQEINRDDTVIPINANAHSWKKGSAYVSRYGIDSYSRARKDKCKYCGKKRTVKLGNTAYKGGLPKVKISKPKAGKKKAIVKWKKISTKNKKKIGGVEIQVKGNGLNKVFTAGKGKTSKTIKGLKSKKKYKVRVRSYKGKRTSKKISKWSTWKTVKVK